MVEISDVLEDLLPDITRIEDETSVIIIVLCGTAQGSRKFFPAAQGEAVSSDGGCRVLECINTTHYLQLHLHSYTIHNEPMYRGMCPIRYFLFSHLIIAEPPFHAFLIVFLH
jgi:hypothetical protein